MQKKVLVVLAVLLIAGMPGKEAIPVAVTEPPRVLGAEPLPQAAPPYPPSPVIGDIVFDFASHRREAGGDNWCVTWADDGHMYCSFNDGNGFSDMAGTDPIRWGVARIEGDYDNYVGYDRQGGKNAEFPTQDLGYSWGMVSIGGVLYYYGGQTGAPLYY